MKELLKQYLIHTDHYLKDKEILEYYSSVVEDTMCYKVVFCNEHLLDILIIEVEYLLAFLFELNFKGDSHVQ